MSVLRYALLAVVGLLGCTAQLSAQSADEFLGDWQVTLSDRTQASFRLQIERGDSGLEFYADGSPITATINQDQISFPLDVYDGGDALRINQFTGRLASGVMQGRYIPETSGVPGVPGDPVDWRAEPYVAYTAVGGNEIGIDDFEGFWIVQDRGIKKAMQSFTAEGRALVDQYRDMDDPINRCVHPGLLRTMRARPGVTAIDIFLYNDVLKIDYVNAIANAQRHIYLDGRDFPNNITPSFMGYSIGQWNNGKLSVETRGFKPMFYDSNGAPVSEQAVLYETMWIDASGNLEREYEFVDPRYYSRPALNSGTLIRRDSEMAEIYDCDTHLFYRNLDISSELDEYFRRARSWRR